MFSTSDNVVQSALAGDATALARLSLVPDDIDAGRLVLLFDHALAHGTSLCFPGAKARDLALQALRAWLEEESALFNRRMVECLECIGKSLPP